MSEPTPQLHPAVRKVRPTLWQRFLARFRGERPDPKTGIYEREDVAAKSEDEGRVVHVSLAEVRAQQKAADVQHTPGFGANAWERLLDQSRLMAEAKTVFLMDSRGLMIACRGETELHEAEGIGVRLLLALEQACNLEIDGDKPHAMTIGFRDTWVTGIQLELGDPLLIGIVGPYPVFRRRAVQTIQEAFRVFLTTIDGDEESSEDASEGAA